MRVLILGFDNKQEIDEVMEKLIAESGCYLFSVVCGGADNAAYDWAIDAGAPIEQVVVDKPQQLLNKADYLILKVCTSTPSWMKNLLMAWKANGKHGTVVKGE